MPFADTPPGWLADRFAEASRIWVTEDSVSMVYEALSSGAAVGVLPVPRIKIGRVVRGLDELLSKRLATSFDAWRSGVELQRPVETFNEAKRVSQEILGRFNLSRVA